MTADRLHIHIGGSFAFDANLILRAADRAKRGEPFEPASHISFENWPTFFRTMTPMRMELLQYIHSRGTVRSVRALAQGLGRDYRRVHDDVAALVEAGLVERRGTELMVFWDGVDADIDAPHAHDELSATGR
jgi:predicted transcriptional regulator